MGEYVYLSQTSSNSTKLSHNYLLKVEGFLVAFKILEDVFTEACAKLQLRGRCNYPPALSDYPSI
jgi:hypothetical protein